MIHFSEQAMLKCWKWLPARTRSFLPKKQQMVGILANAVLHIIFTWHDAYTSDLVNSNLSCIISCLYSTGNFFLEVYCNEVLLEVLPPSLLQAQLRCTLRLKRVDWQPSSTSTRRQSVIFHLVATTAESLSTQPVSVDTPISWRYSHSSASIFIL